MITRLDLADSGGGGADLGPLTDRVTTLEDTYVQSTRYATITATAGTVSPVAGASIILDFFGGGLDCDIQAVESGEPNGLEAYDTAGAVIVATLNAGGAYVLSGTPVDASVALVYRVRQKFKDFSDTDADILGEVDFLGLQAVSHSLWETRRSGFVEWSGSGDYWSWTALTNTFTLLRGGEGYIRYKEVYFLGNQEIVVNDGEVVYLYIDATGVLRKSATVTEGISIGLFQVDTAGETIFLRKNYSFCMDAGAAAWQQRGFGACIEGIAGDANISRYTTGTGGVTTDRMVNITSGLVVDSDIETSWDAITTGLTCNHTYHAGLGVFLRYSLSKEFPPYYNSSGTPTAIATGRRGVFRLFCTVDSLNSSSPQFISEMHTADFGTLGAAQTAIGNGTISNLGGRNKSIAQLGYVVVRASATGGYVEYVQPQITTFRQLVGGGGVASTADNVLTDATNFNGALGAANTTVQSALEKLDDVVGASRAVSASTTLTTADSFVTVAAASANVELTLPLSPPVGKTIRIYVDSGTFSCNILPQTGYNIDGYTTSIPLKLFLRGSVMLMHLGGEVWRILLTENVSFRVVTANTSNMLSGEEIVRLIPGANQTFYIYASVGNGKRLTILRDKFQGTSYSCTIADGNNYYINNLASIKLSPGEMITLVSGNGEWFIESTTGTSDMQTAPNKATPIDADKFGLMDTAANNAGSTVTLAQLKAVMKTYFDTLYTPL